MKTHANRNNIMDSFRILGSLWAFLVMFSFTSGCSQPKQESDTTPVIRTDVVEGNDVVATQKLSLIHI
ncbi:MAG: hypothetical protein MPJ25_14150, partial [Pirellulales bacterium]|nr:hypothetical protein [Pirellulales bacterium]